MYIVLGLDENGQGLSITRPRCSFPVVHDGKFLRAAKDGEEGQIAHALGKDEWEFLSIWYKIEKQVNGKLENGPIEILYVKRRENEEKIPKEGLPATNDIIEVGKTIQKYIAIYTRRISIHMLE